LGYKKERFCEIQVKACSQPLEHRTKQLTKETTYFVPETGLANLKNSSIKNSMANLNDDQVAAILADMRDSQAQKSQT
jgi:hypothetical protein